MAFRFIHTADWHIGRKFNSLGHSEMARRLADARLDAIERIAREARLFGARHVLCAGDAFDGPDVDRQTLRRTCAQLGDATDVTWHFIPANHDPAEATALWSEVRCVGNVKVHAECALVELEPGVMLATDPWQGKFQRAGDLAEVLSRAGARDDALCIGLAHGSVTGFGGSDDALQMPLDVDRLLGHGLSYLALGDWHGTMQVNDRCWYSGTPEVDRWKENNAGHVLRVTLPGDGGSADVTPVKTTKFDWLVLIREVRNAFDVDALEEELDGARVGRVNLLVRLVISGVASSGLRRQLESLIGGLEDVAAYVDVDLSGLRREIGADERARLAHVPVIDAAVRKLRAIGANDTREDQAHAEDALIRLMQIASELEITGASMGASTGVDECDTESGEREAQT